MAQEDENQTQRCSNSTNTSSGVSGAGKSNNIGRSSKKQRPKKVPQRGLGVAQLEKIRIEEEQQKKDGVVSSSPTVCHNSPHLSLPFPSFHLSNQSSSTPLCVQNIGYNLWSSYGYNIEKECSSGLDPGLIFKTNLSSLPYEYEPIWPLPSLMQRAQASSSMVNNLTSGTSSTSILNFQMEPPSNQSCYGNCTCLLPEEYKVIGMKRSYPLSLDNAPSTPIHTKYPSIVHSINAQTEVASSSNGSTFNFELGTPNFRKEHYYSTSKGVFDGDFLTLALPTTTSMSSSSNSKHLQSDLINGEPAYQARSEDSILRQGATGTGYESNECLPYYSFFPPAMLQIDPAATLSMANCNGEVGHADLNLKL
ncbi:hypothetical protein HRI_004811000 [Hibiscus trionum]|uniref:Uncharacterized protein n=1 Tax=Hibiscus trionum TaxID=183268 RepID=A0A9W7JB51_HIBTR|nr:hypothetical protein HRI_004811000 [Hibiscus trionum]